MSERVFTKANCMDWLDSLEDESVDLWIIDPPYNVLTGNMKNKNGAAVFHSRYTAKVSPSESDLEKSKLMAKERAKTQPVNPLASSSSTAASSITVKPTITSLLSNLQSEKKIASEYYTNEEMAQFKKKRKRVRKVRQIVFYLI